MGLFLFLKQIVDVLYQYKILDYFLVLFAIILLFYQIIKEKKYLHVFQYLVPADYLIAGLGVVYFISFLHYPQAYGTFMKVESCLLIYFLGRVYGSKVMQHGKYLALAGYLVIYANFIYRFYQFGYKLILTGPEKTLLNAGGLYYYKTDLAIGVIVAVLFIYMFSEQKILKWITIVPVGGYLVFYSGARIGQVIMAFEYLCLCLCELEKSGKLHFERKNKGLKWTPYVVIGFVVLSFIMLQVFPFEQVAALFHIETGAGSWIENLMHSRHIIWWDILSYFREQSFMTRLFGVDLGTESMHNSKEMPAHSAYIKQIYATGYAGCVILVLFMLELYRSLRLEKNRKMRYIVIVLWIMLLGSGLSIESLESTQMSWFPMLFAGAMINENIGKQVVSVNDISPQ